MRLGDLSRFPRPERGKLEVESVLLVLGVWPVLDTWKEGSIVCKE